MTGPQFLGLYLVIAIVLNLWLRWYIQRKEQAGTIPHLASAPDPYMIALLN